MYSSATLEIATTKLYRLKLGEVVATLWSHYYQGKKARIHLVDSSDRARSEQARDSCKHSERYGMLYCLSSQISRICPMVHSGILCD